MKMTPIKGLLYLMKGTLCAMIFFSSIASLKAQGVVITDDPSAAGTVTPHSKAVLELKTIGKKGFLAPRVSELETQDMTGANGMLVYLESTDPDSTGYWYYDNGTWKKLSNNTEDDGDWAINGPDVYKTTGTVGIGVSSPLSRFHVAEPTTASNQSIVTIMNTADFGTDHALTLNNAYDRDIGIAFQNVGVDKWTIRNDGPTATTGDDFVIKNGSGSSVMTIEQGGSIGIGTSAPGIAKTYVSNDGTNVGMYIGNGVPFGQAKLELDGPAATHIWVAESGARKFSVASGGDTYIAGNLGIGVSTPTAKLQISSTSGTPALMLDGEDNIWFHGGHVRMTTHDGYGNWQIKSGADNNDKYTEGTGAVKLRIDESGKLFIQTAAAGTVGNTIGWNTGFYQAPDGNVGIGLTNPSAKLDVNGTAKINGLLDMKSNKISNLAEPVAAQDATTKAYVDAAIESSHKKSEPQIVEGSGTGSTYSTIVNATGSGYITGITMTCWHGSGPSTSDVEITIDGDATPITLLGVPYTSHNRYNIDAYNYRISEIPIQARFQSSLVIKSKKRSGSGCLEVTVHYALEE